ncbi:putative phloem protein [Helianthus anomalus]
MWFSLHKSGKKCHMLLAKAALTWSWKNKKALFPESNDFLTSFGFGEAIQWVDDCFIIINTEVRSQLVSSETTYACYLVYKLPEHQSGFEGPVKIEYKLCETGDTIWYIYLTTPQSQTPVIRPKVGQNTHNPLNWPKFKGLQRQRKDGWIEVKIWEFQAATKVIMDLTLNLCNHKAFSGIIMEYIEFRPI